MLKSKKEKLLVESLILKWIKHTIIQGLLRVFFYEGLCFYKIEDSVIINKINIVFVDIKINKGKNNVDNYNINVII